jgi:hypothetical protein
MISTKALITDIFEVPREWVFEHYLNLEEKLIGQDVRLKSPFNPSDRRPSAYVYYSTSGNRYMFKDFSTNIGGDGVTLVQKLFNLTTRGEAAYKIIQDYNKWILVNKNDIGIREYKVHQRFKVKEFVVRQWNTLDQKYWTKFHIGSKLLERFNVKPLESYTMSKEVDGNEKTLIISGRHSVYGYFREDGTLYKIYQPLVTDHKFIKIRDYIQGTDQLTYKKKYLVICSSLKDVMAFTRLGYKEAEAVAPDSENTLIPAHVISAYLQKYESVCTLFDNDKAGIEAMEKYKLKYNIPGVHLELSKDLSDSIKDYGINTTGKVLTPLLKKALKN